MKKIVRGLFLLVIVLSSVFLFLQHHSNHTALFGDVTSRSIMLTELATGEQIAEKKAHKKIPIASLTKMMTALCVIESAADLSDTVEINEESLNRLNAQGMAISGFAPNVPVTIRDLLYGMMLPSGADAAEALAEYVSGGTENFVGMMNEKASELGLKDTHFSNVVGYDERENYSTAADLSILLSAALTNQLFKEIFTTQQFVSQPTTNYPQGVFLESTLLKTGESLSFGNGTILGGKTGYTDKAGLCLASLAEINGQLYLLVNCHADGEPTSDPLHIMEAKKIYQRLATELAE
ncbi:D-alanyl-D-alanine carboxypeptidase family protein [Vagococcus acidifermentans]|uniref:Peptidase S11 D-alanyl-D-alanine carboxypeptidase A N-terminal domain-containing protein n=1 Tax=Vagococcus acidifermentans TaxID=564710 RepID=A0A430AQ68_9ENTE|nr:serine hydrolase [Vagococcus acidifermentans]RSU10280.1 hypothetical protein CBF27_11075 [Vagococcus acidifermentans]